MGKWTEEKTHKLKIKWQEIDSLLTREEAKFLYNLLKNDATFVTLFDDKDFQHKKVYKSDIVLVLLSPIEKIIENSWKKNECLRFKKEREEKFLDFTVDILNQFIKKIW